MLFSPEHVSVFRPSLEEGAARAGRSLDSFRICPGVSVLIDDDLARARDAMRPFLALYIGGMGSREKNFYNRLACEYGFEAEATRVQDLYLDGRKDEAAAALPDGFIDLVSLCGPADRVRDGLRRFEAAGVDTLIASPMAWTAEERSRQLRLLAELAGPVAAPA
jgi:alkanesulfonate monooxygenase SsuD/methylene tetrahydromethanopterin reductase-like flavin-dependent oxidoreductase (luciferase family)